MITKQQIAFLTEVNYPHKIVKEHLNVPRKEDCDKWV